MLPVKRYIPTILTCISAVGVVGTAILTAKATPKAAERIELAKKKKGEKLTKLETIKAAYKPYIPAALVGVGTIVCIFGTNTLNKRQQASLISVYALLDKSYKQYKNKVIELYGKETHDEIVEAIAVETAKEVGITAGCLCNNTCLTDEESCGDPVLFYEEWSGRYFESTIEQVIAAEYHLNRNFCLRGYAILNEFYDFLGIDETDYGNTVGWTPEDGFYWIDFDHRKVTMDDGLECYIIETPWGPSAEFLEYYY